MSKRKPLEDWQVEDAQRLKALFDKHVSMTQDQFGASYDLGTQGMVWQYLNARSPLNVSAVTKFADGIGCDVADISPKLAAEIARLNREPAKVYGRRLNDSDVLAAGSGGRSGINIPMLDARASMGTGYALPDHESVIDALRLSEDWCKRNLVVSNLKNLAALTAYGDSMRPTFEDSDILLVDRGVTELKIDAVYVLQFRDELYVKRIQRRPDGHIVIKSDNPLYDPFVVDPAQNHLAVLGRVVWAWNGRKL